jgi:hypothetical protein
MRSPFLLPIWHPSDGDADAMSERRPALIIIISDGDGDAMTAGTFFF